MPKKCLLSSIVIPWLVTPLMVTCKIDRMLHTIILYHLIELISCIQVGYTALHWACQNGHRDIVSLLWTCGADAQAQTKVILCCNSLRYLDQCDLEST